MCPNCGDLLVGFECNKCSAIINSDATGMEIECAVCKRPVAWNEEECKFCSMEYDGAYWVERAEVGKLAALTSLDDISILDVYAYEVSCQSCVYQGTEDCAPLVNLLSEFLLEFTLPDGSRIEGCDEYVNISDYLDTFESNFTD